MENQPTTPQKKKTNSRPFLWFVIIIFTPIALISFSRQDFYGGVIWLAVVVYCGYLLKKQKQ